MGKRAGLKARPVCKAAGLMSAQLSWDLALVRLVLQGESLADLAVVTRVVSAWLWRSPHPGLRSLCPSHLGPGWMWRRTRRLPSEESVLEFASCFLRHLCRTHMGDVEGTSTLPCDCDSVSPSVTAVGPVSKAVLC